jgi:hypothetical protein
LGLFAAVRPARVRQLPPKLPCPQAELWMVDALPGVGPGRRDAALQSVRAGMFEELQQPARIRAEEVFNR